MNRSSLIGSGRVTRWLALTTIALAFACGDSTDPNPAGGDFDPDCRSCRQPGDTCEFSINCTPGSICNDESDPLFVADAAKGQCIKVICASSAECDAPKVCSLEKICQAPLCQSNGDCGGGKVCIAGACTDAPGLGDVMSCKVVTAGGILQQGKTAELDAVALNRNGVALAAIAFEWASDQAGRVAVSGNTATGGMESGTANLTAKAGTMDCTGSARIENFAAVPAGDARVIVTNATNNIPVDGATVWLMTATSSASAQTGANGAATFNGVGGDVTSATAIKAGWTSVTVLQPGTKDLVVGMPVKTNPNKAGGFRGSVDLSATKKADIQLAIVAPAFPTNILDLELESIIGDFVETRIDAPDLGLNDEVVDLPGGIMLALGSKMFTNDSDAAGGGLRCQNDSPDVRNGELGCYVSRGPEGPNAAWVLGGQLKLSAISSVAGQISGALGGDTSDLPIGDILTAVLPLLRDLNHGINAGISINHVAKVAKPGVTGADCANNASDGNDDEKCQANFAEYQKISLAADQQLGVLSKVSVPTLPQVPGGTFSSAVVAIAGAVVPGRGLVPLGLSAGLDTLTDTETPDGRIAGVEEPFGPNSAALDDGFVPLSTAPAHSGIEGSRLVLALLALDIDSIAGDGGLQLSTIVNYVDRFDETENVTGSFMPYPSGVFDVGNASYTPTAATPGAALVRIALTRGTDEWLVWAPHSGTTAAQLPNIPALRGALLGTGVDALLQMVGTSVPYADLFTFGSGKTADQLGLNTTGFAIQQCSTAADALCKIQ